MEQIGFIGVGSMGASIASRLVDHHDLLVNDRNPAAAGELLERGAAFAEPDRIAESCRVVFLCLPGPAQVRDLLLVDDLVGRLKPGTVIIDHTSSTPTTDAEILSALEGRQVDYADAPIAGGIRRAREGTATLMVGATPETFARVEPLLHEITSEVVHTGKVGTGHAMKLVNNLLNACMRFSTLEMVQLAEAAGLERDTIIHVLNSSSGRNYVTEYTYPKLLSSDPYQLQGFTISLMLKDLRLANELARSLEHGTPIGTLAEAFTRQAVERFGPDADQSQMMAEWYES